ncbi:MAG: hypothetical protein HZT43_18765 [Exiguobacterium profundum]|nr:MAG: hypothetical protein HZT43_18765 [Exiguobacterium profundum]
MGSFGVPANASGAAGRLSALGLPVATTKTTRNGKSLQIVLAPSPARPKHNAPCPPPAAPLRRRLHPLVQADRTKRAAQDLAPGAKPGAFSFPAVRANRSPAG